MNINYYTDKQYPNPPCWCLVSDVYLNELGLQVADFKTINSSVWAIASAFRIALHKGEHGFRKVDEPQDYALALMARKAGGTPTHCGIYYQGSILHANENGGYNEELATISDVYKRIEYWIKNAD